VSKRRKPHWAFLKGVHAECWDSIGRRSARDRDRLMAQVMTTDIANIPQ
jgi:hypothetical protein